MEVESWIVSSNELWSKITESELDEEDQLKDYQTNLKTFGDLKKKWSHFFMDDVSNLKIVEKIAEGAQAEIYAGRWPGREAGMFDINGVVFKVFKRDSSMQDLVKKLPLKFLQYCDHANVVGLWNPRICHIFGALLLEGGRFAFAMERYWGDLRRLIDLRTQLNQGPFSTVVAKRIMLEIAEGMEILHELGIVHRDLKASNIFIKCNVVGDPKQSNITIESLIDDVHGDTGASTMRIQPLARDADLFDVMDDAFMGDAFSCVVGDYECSQGVAGIGFWRAPEILKMLKIHDRKLSSFTEKTDVYSYSMTCFEVLTGLYPFEDLYPFNKYDVAISGKRPDLPNFIEDDVKSLLSRCWHSDPSKRPTFVQICKELRIMIIGNSNPIPLEPAFDIKRNPKPFPLEQPLGEKENLDPTPFKVPPHREASLEPYPSESPSDNEENLDPMPSKLLSDDEENLDPMPSKLLSDDEENLDRVPSKLLSDEEENLDPMPSKLLSDDEENLDPMPSKLLSDDEENLESIPSEPSLDSEENLESIPSEPSLDSEENLELLTELLMLLEPISSILASFTDFGYRIFYSFIQWSRVFSKDDSFKSKRSYDSFKSVQFLGQGFSGFIYETTWFTWYGKKKWGRFARKDFPRVHSLVFENESARLVNLKHPNVVKVFCWTVDRLGCSLVMEFVKTDIESVVEKKKGVHNITSSFKPFQLAEAIYIMMHIARAMEYLHSRDVGLGHGDLRPNNILVDLEATPVIVKVVDFGLIESKKSSMLVSNYTQFVRTLEWKAPEMWKDLPTLIDSADEDLWEELDSTVQKNENGRVAREQADVYSFAIICTYIMGGTISYPKSNLHQLQQEISSGTRRPKIPKCPESLKELIELSWSSDPEKRPRFSQLQRQLKEYLELVTQKKQTIASERKRQRILRQAQGWLSGALTSTLNTNNEAEFIRLGIDRFGKYRTMLMDPLLEL